MADNNNNNIDTTKNDDNNSEHESQYNKLYNKQLLYNDYYIVRHGQSKANVEKLIVSNPSIACINYGLSNVGINQVQTISVPTIIQYYLSNAESYTGGIVLVSSDLLRAKETATIIYNGIVDYNSNINNTIKIPLYWAQKKDSIIITSTSTAMTDESSNNQDTTIIYDERLRERNFGQYDLTNDDNYNKVWENDILDANHTIHNVESVNSVLLRVTSLVNDYDNNTNFLSSTTTNENKKYMIICIAHGDVLQILQTACIKQSGQYHRTAVEHLQTATVRQLKLYTVVPKNN
jgi:broad specificity phosphatase PhoE